MIIKEFYMMRKDGIKLYKTYSDISVYIRKVGTNEEYTEAIDTETALYEYEETAKPIDYDMEDDTDMDETIEDNEEITDEEFLDMLEEVL